jgi:hypothetical protein
MFRFSTVSRGWAAVFLGYLSEFQSELGGMPQFAPNPYLGGLAPGIAISSFDIGQ